MTESEKSLSDRISEAEAEYRLVSALENDRQRAEIAYVLAMLFREAGDQEETRQYANKSIALFEKVNVVSLQDARSRYDVFAGVVIPTLIHEDVVRQKFAEFHL